MQGSGFCPFIVALEKQKMPKWLKYPQNIEKLKK